MYVNGRKIEIIRSSHHPLRNIYIYIYIERERERKCTK